MCSQSFLKLLFVIYVLYNHNGIVQNCNIHVERSLQTYYTFIYINLIYGVAVSI